jgi:superfamily II RNA helicase
MASPKHPLAAQLSGADAADADELLDRFLAYVAGRGLSLYPAQEEAILEILAGKHVILSTPTGSGKSLVATAMIFRAMAQGGRSFYTCPIKALVSEKFFALCQDFGPNDVGMMTGDASINRDAPIICCTAEILANMALRRGIDCPADVVVMDEFHYYADRERGAAWQIPLLILERSIFLLMSATLGDAAPFARHLEDLTGRSAALVASGQRPVPLDFDYRETPLHETVDDLVKQRRYPVYIVNFTQRACAEEAQNLMSVNYSTREEKQAILEAIAGFSFDSPYGKEVQKLVRHGIGLHHAGLLPKYRLLVEKLSQQGLLKIICGTDTLGVGVNIPIRTVLFTKLCKFDGNKTGVLSVREFHQIAGRAGRKGFDEQGSVVAQAPAHVIENIRIDLKKSQDPGKYKKLVRQKPPNKGYVHWDRATFNRLVSSPPEDLQSQFSVSHGMLISLLQNPSVGRRGGYGALIGLIDRAHIDARTRRMQRRLAAVLFKSLRAGGILRLAPIVEGRPGRRVELEASLQDDFSLHQTLSLYLLDVLPMLDPELGTHALDVLSMVEAILEDPDAILFRQIDKLKGEKIAELKSQGVEYDDRMAELEKIEYPKPNKDFTYATFNAFTERHPWVGRENIRPKSVARDMYERFLNFDECIREYDLHRSEGLLLRYLTDVYKTLVQTVPASAKTQEVDEIVEYLRDIVRGVDSSLLDEWEDMQFGGASGRPVAPTLSREYDLAADVRALTIRARADLHRLLKALSIRDWEAALRALRGGSEPAGGAAPGDEPWTAARLEEAMAPFFEQRRQLLVHHAARTAEFTHLKQTAARQWSAFQTMVDPEGENDWSIEAEIDLPAPPVPDGPLITLRRIGA